MRMVWLVWALPLVLSTFLWRLNAYLHGSKKERSEIILANLILASVVLAWILSGWKLAVAAFIGAAVLQVLFAKPAYWVAKRMIKYPELGNDAYFRAEEQGLAAVERESGLLASIDARKARAEQERRHAEQCIRNAIEIHSISRALNELDASEDDLGAMYRVLSMRLSPENRERAICNADLVRFFLEVTIVDEDHDCCRRYFRTEQDNITFGIWAGTAPSGPRPR